MLLLPLLRIRETELAALTMGAWVSKEVRCDFAVAHHIRKVIEPSIARLATSAEECCVSCVAFVDRQMDDLLCGKFRWEIGTF